MTFYFYYRILNSKGAEIGDINSLRLLLGHDTLDMVLKYSRYIDVQKALAGHQQFSPLDRLYRDGNHRGGDEWGWRY